MRAQSHRRTAEDLKTRLLRLEGLPLRPVSARTFIAAQPDAPTDEDPEELHVGDPVVVDHLDGLTVAVRRAEEWEMIR